MIPVEIPRDRENVTSVSLRSPTLEVLLHWRPCVLGAFAVLEKHCSSTCLKNILKDLSFLSASLLVLLYQHSCLIFPLGALLTKQGRRRNYRSELQTDSHLKIGLGIFIDKAVLVAHTCGSVADQTSCLIFLGPIPELRVPAMEGFFPMTSFGFALRRRAFIC